MRSTVVHAGVHAEPKVSLVHWVAYFRHGADLNIGKGLWTPVIFASLIYKQTVVSDVSRISVYSTSVYMEMVNNQLLGKIY